LRSDQASLIPDQADVRNAHRDQTIGAGAGRAEAKRVARRARASCLRSSSSVGGHRRQHTSIRSVWPLRKWQSGRGSWNRVEGGRGAGLPSTVNAVKW